MEQVVCNLCGSSDAQTLYVLPDYLMHRDDVQATLVRCSTCGLIYQNPRPTLAEMATHYPPEYEMYAAEPVTEDASWLLKRAIEYGISKRWHFVTRYKQDGRLLDVGCATGTFLRGAPQNRAWELYGVEISEYAGRIARDRYRLNVKVGTLEQAAYRDDYFDVITMWDVLEHLHDPASSLAEIRRILKRDGILVARVPNAASRDARLFGRFWVGWEPPRHLYGFTPKTLGAFLSQAGLRPKAWSGGIAAYTTFLLSLRIWAIAHKKENRSWDFFIKAMYHPIMRLITVPVFYVYKIGLQGSLMVVTATQNQSAHKD
jgi:SAM-dependent methyltransferase